MSPPMGWQNPITAGAGETQVGVAAHLLLPSRGDLSQLRLDFQRSLLDSGQRRATPIQVTKEAVIWDGHHGVRAAAEKGLAIDVLVIELQVKAAAPSILDLPVR